MPPLPRTMRIYALPLTRATSKRGALVYYLASLPPKQKSESKPESRIMQLATRGLKKVNDTWNGWGEMEGGWQRKLYDFGQKAQSRIAFEELSLKSIDPALGPKVTSSGEGAKMLDEVHHSNKHGSTITLFYPSSFKSMVLVDPIPHLQSQISNQGPKSRRECLIYAATIPFTAPFMLIPIIPNIPFFFVAWRSWGNYKAWKASEYLEMLFTAKAIVAEKSSQLEAAYRISSPPSHTTTSKDSTQTSPIASSSDAATEDEVVLRERSIPKLIASLGLPHEVGQEVTHALRQARDRLGLPKHDHTSKERENKTKY